MTDIVVEQESSESIINNLCSRMEKEQIPAHMRDYIESQISKLLLLPPPKDDEDDARYWAGYKDGVSETLDAVRATRQPLVAEVIEILR